MSDDRVRVSIWFDTEDYSDPPSDDAAMRLADLLTDLGVVGTFKLVGEKLRTLERRGRGDVIAALGKQDIGYHTDWHTKHPTVPEYLVESGWDDGIELFLQYERPGVEDIRRVFGQTPSCHGQAGAAWSPQAFAACHDLGIPIYLDDGGGNHLSLDDLPHRYCNLLCISHLGDAIVHVPPRTGDFLDRVKAEFDVAVGHARRTGGRVVGIYSHEVEFSHVRFADGINFGDGENPKSYPLVPAPVRSAEDVESSYRQFREFVAYVKNYKGVEIVAPADLLPIYADAAAAVAYDGDAVARLAEAFLDNPGYAEVSDGWLNPAEIFSLVAQRLHARARGNSALRAVPSSPFGPKGIVDPRWGRNSVTVSGRDLLSALPPTLRAWTRPAPCRR